MAQLARSPLARLVYLVLGLMFLGIGLVGLVLPGIPTTGPVLAAAFFFSRSSERFENWLLNHRVFGPLIRDWRGGLGFTIRAKVVAVVAIALTFTLTVGWAIDSLVVRVLLVLFAIGLVTYILRMPTKPTVPESVE